MAQKKLTYGSAVNEMEEILVLLENNELDVDELSIKVKRVSELIKFCKQKLTDTEKEVDEILKEI
jgi:exodeoxyribonuclease VII small subunit